MATTFTEAGFVFGWQDMAILASALSVLGSISLIMLSRLFDLKELEATAKKEFVFAASTVFIVMFVVLTLAFSDTVFTKIGKQMYVDAITQNAVKACAAQTTPSTICAQLKSISAVQVNAPTLIDVMLLYMEPPAKCSQQFLDVLYYLSIPIEACSSIFMEIYMSEHMSCFGLKWAAERITNSAQMLTFYMFAYYLIYHALTFVKYYAGFFFGLGVILRALPPSRGAGAYLMALSFGLYFVLPFAYILVYAVSFNHISASFIAAKDVQQGNIEYLCSTPAIGDVQGLQCGAGSISKQFELRSWLEANKSAVSEFFNSIHDIMLHFISVICVFPLIAFVVLFTFVLNTTNLFGGNIPEIGRGLVRLI